VLSDCPKNNNTATSTPQLTTSTTNGIVTRMSTSVSPMTETKDHGLLITLSSF
jgi:hypothetical protein